MGEWEEPEDLIGPFDQPDRRDWFERVEHFVSAHAFSLLIGAMLLMLGIILWVNSRSAEITLAQYEQIRIGMTEKEIDNLLGFTPSGPPPIIPPFDPMEEPPVWKAWSDGKTTVVIGFVQGKVRMKERISTLKP